MTSPYHKEDPTTPERVDDLMLPDDDTDNTSTTYEQYVANKVNGDVVGNGFRLVGVPVNDGAVGATPFISGAMTFDSTGATGCGAGSATRDKVASGVMIASALRSTTTSPLPSAAGCTE